jgi:hypothetical protein
MIYDIELSKIHISSTLDRNTLRTILCNISASHVHDHTALCGSTIEVMGACVPFADQDLRIRSRRWSFRVINYKIVINSREINTLISAINIQSIKIDPSRHWHCEICKLFGIF